MKLNDAYLCPDCDEVFSLKEQNIPHIHHPVCPTCGTTNVLNLGRVLNRKEDPDEPISGLGETRVEKTEISA